MSDDVKSFVISLSTDTDAIEQELITWFSVASQLKALKSREDDAWDALNRRLDAELQPEVGALFIFDDGAIQAGRTYQRRGAGIDWVAVANDVKSEEVKGINGKPLYKRLFREEKVTTTEVKWDEDAALAEAALNPELNEIIRRHTERGTLTLTRVNPVKATKQHVREAITFGQAKALLMAELDAADVEPAEAESA